MFKLYAVVLLLAAVLMVGGCKSPELHTRLSPPLVQLSSDPWREAEILARMIPNSSTVIGHGESMQPLYPPGTVLVLQRLQWKNLQPGMTAIYNRDPDNPYHMVAHVLLKKELGDWVAQGLANAHVDGTVVTEKNYVGTVVAAFRREDPLPESEVIAKLPRYQSGTCTLRCHTS